MKMIHSITIAALTAAGIAMTVFATGCQVPGKVLSTETSSVCPLCEKQTLTSQIKGLTYTKHVCPTCKNVSVLNPAEPHYTRDYVGPKDQSVHVCQKCETLVSTCPLCQKKE